MGVWLWGKSKLQFCDAISMNSCTPMLMMMIPRPDVHMGSPNSESQSINTTLPELPGIQKTQVLSIEG